MRPGRLAIAAAAAADPTAEICGIDPAPEMIELARRNAARAGARAGFEIGTIEALPYPADRFDVVLSSMMLHHLPDDLKRHGLVEMRRVLKPGGRIVAVDFGAAPHGGIGHMLCVLRLRTGSDHIELLRSMFLAASFDAIEVGWTGSRGLAFIRCRKSTTTYLA